ncbi:MAG: penicillin-binding protein activator [Halofilum sp. (in: g-proteobacteria)]|nr:penicillin-binding protein activator [Halofilum sp. (in: g-proteobacteria)]
MSTADVERAQRLVDEGRPLAAVRIYRDLAAAADAAGRQRWHLRIVELLFDQGYPELALEWNRRIDDAAVPAELRDRRRVLDARAAVEQREGIGALRRLPALDPEMPRELRARLLAVRADAYALTGQPGRAVLARLQRAELLATAAAIDANHEAIWSLLQSVPVDRLERLSELDEAPIMRGWVELARAVRSARLGERPVPEALRDWRNRFPDHPAAARFVESLRERVIEQLTYPKKIALLLPLSGRLADPARAIRDGLLAAYYDQPGYIARPDIAVYDTGEDGLAPAAAYERAVAEGAAFVIGPLAKDAVARLAERDRLEVPVLSLNYLPDERPARARDFYQFGLLPEDEARQAAEAAVQNRRLNAVTLVPAGDWGARMLGAFRTRFDALGGVVLETSRYNSRATDYGRPIQALLNLDASYARARTLQSTIDRKVRFEPRRRQDVEVVFVAAMPKQARLIEPQLEFHRAAEIPAYATSHVFTGTPDPEADWDMNGLYFTEIPWILENLDSPSELYARIAERWPGLHERFPRLHALGMDAFALLPHLERLRVNPEAGLAGRTGRLTLDARRRVHRQLRWAVFIEGRPVPVPRPGAANPEDAEAVGADVRERADGPGAAPAGDS